MMVEIAKSTTSTMKDVVGCQVTLNQDTWELTDTAAIDFSTETSAYEELSGLVEDSSSKDWSKRSGAELFCQDSHCYVTCNLQRPIYADDVIASQMVKSSEDSTLYYLGANMKVKGTYFTYTDVPSSGSLLWSKGTSDDYFSITLPDAANRLLISNLAAATTILLPLYSLFLS